jgi:hypothetical protein
VIVSSACLFSLPQVPNRASFPSRDQRHLPPTVLPPLAVLLPNQHSLFACPLFSWSYELLFPQPLSFDDNPNCPLGVGVLCSSSLPQFDGFPVTPFTATHSRNAPVTSFPAAHAKLPFCKSFRCHTSEKVGGWGLWLAMPSRLALSCAVRRYSVIASATAVPRSYCAKHLSPPPFPGRSESLFRALPVSQRSGGNCYGNY